MPLKLFSFLLTWGNTCFVKSGVDRKQMETRSLAVSLASVITLKVWNCKLFAPRLHHRRRYWETDFVGWRLRILRMRCATDLRSFCVFPGVGPELEFLV